MDGSFSRGICRGCNCWAMTESVFKFNSYFHIFLQSDTPFVLTTAGGSGSPTSLSVWWGDNLLWFLFGFPWWPVGLNGFSYVTGQQGFFLFCELPFYITYLMTLGCFSLSFFFFKDFIFSLFLPKAPQYIVVYSSLWVLLVVACGTLPQRGSMNSAMSAPRIRTNETLGPLQRSART